MIRTIIVIGAVVSIVWLGRVMAMGVTAFHCLMTECDHDEDERRFFGPTTSARQGIADISG